MAWITEEYVYSKVKATTEDGAEVCLTDTRKISKTYYPVRDMNIRGNDNMLDIVGDICNSGKEVKILSAIIRLADGNNNIVMTSISATAESIGCTRELLTKVLKKADEHALLHKISTGNYMLNPYQYMPTKLTAAGYAAQEAAQMRWRKLTGLLTAKQLDALIKLGHYLSVSGGLRPTEFNISVAEQYASKGNITDKQKESVLKSVK